MNKYVYEHNFKFKLKKLLFIMNGFYDELL